MDGLATARMQQLNLMHRDSMEVLSEPRENGEDCNDREATEESLVTGDSSVVLETTDTQAAEGFPSKGSNSWDVKNEDAPKVPPQFKTVLACELPVGIQDFFQCFFSDDSKKFYESFHKKCGDEGFHCTNWAKDQHFGHVRDVSFHHPVKVYFGPKASDCQEVQRYRIYQNNHLIVETSQQMNDIPYGDYFRVEGRWDVVPITSKATPHCAVNVYVDVAFSKKTVWKGKIEQGTYDECKDVYATWLAEALRLLQEKGLVENKEARRESSIHSAPPARPSEPPKSKSKRKHESGSGQVQGNVKMPKNSSNTTSQALKEKAPPGENTQQQQGVPSNPVPASESSLQEGFLASLTSISHRKLLIILCVMAVLFLIQTGLIIALSRSNKAQYGVLNYPRWGEWHGASLLGGQRGRQDVAWLEHAAQLLWEEINIADARLKNMQSTLDVLKVNMNLVEKFNAKSASSTG